MRLLSEFTAEQWGMVTSRQAGDLDVDGVTLLRLERAGYVDRVRRGVYAATTAAVTEARAEQAAWLALNAADAAWRRPPLDPDGGVLSHQSAARLHGLGELVNDRIAMTVPRRRTSRDPDLWFKTARLSDSDVVVLDGLPVTTALRTICDLLDQHLDGSHLAMIIRDAVEANLVRLDVLAERIGPHALRYGVRRPGDGEALLDRLLAEIGTTTAQLAHRPSPPRASAALWWAVNHQAPGTLQGLRGLLHDLGLGAESGSVVAKGLRFAAGHEAGHDVDHDIAAAEDPRWLPRLAEEQGEDQVQGDRRPRW
ncbi:type IV toxin-antitoxin system AbiEi family antitoxin domain-containing protein [Actinokineospora sp. NBRC 105648]|uniref:type IV toxin-antitoxin system AbiEi family antitoxin domain-containing protein n=1 Tax=Actinokineospora sp. NBRC 105648 TaxID=3032206 RepID=UPI0024A05BFE|nr:type IV toxin-antitoxin system AbiEi family antitoxin domain-containing protein [Actinokineospora sp. NBRC 105648]GLZ43077.1 hypothetical protein Acsp05_67010 [Actinokineospora sp. NBRC 105648]